MMTTCMSEVNGVQLADLKKHVSDGYTPSSATIHELIVHAQRYLFLSRCDCQTRMEITESDDMGVGWEYLDQAIDNAIIVY